MLKFNTKAALIEAMKAGRVKLEVKLAGLSPEEIVRPGMMDEWSVKDILMHLVDWEGYVMNWYQAGLRGETLHLPAEGYTWRDLPELNRRAFESHRAMPLEQVWQAWEGSFTEILAVVEKMDETELFNKNHYAWTGKSWTLAEYIAAGTFKHYEWACREIKPKKFRQEKPLD